MFKNFLTFVCLSVCFFPPSYAMQDGIQDEDDGDSDDERESYQPFEVENEGQGHKENEHSWWDCLWCGRRKRNRYSALSVQKFRMVEIPDAKTNAVALEEQENDGKTKKESESTHGSVVACCKQCFEYLRASCCEGFTDCLQSLSKFCKKLCCSSCDDCCFCCAP